MAVVDLWEAAASAGIAVALYGSLMLIANAARALPRVYSRLLQENESLRRSINEARLAAADVRVEDDGKRVHLLITNRGCNAEFWIRLPEDHWFMIRGRVWSTKRELTPEEVRQVDTIFKGADDLFRMADDFFRLVKPK